MRGRWIAVPLILLTLPPAALCGTGRVIKVLPQFLDTKGRASVSPSLYDRDAYQSILLLHPEKRSGIQFAVHWKSKGAVWEPLTLRVEMRGIAEGKQPKQSVIDLPVFPTGRLGEWTYIPITGAAYRAFGEVTAWRVTLWEGQQTIGEQRSFLW